MAEHRTAPNGVDCVCGWKPVGPETIEVHLMQSMRRRGDTVDHPAHYGGDTTYEAIKVIEAWSLGFCLGNAVKYICRAGKKPKKLDISTHDQPNQWTSGPPDKAGLIEDLKKARWYLDHHLSVLEAELAAEQSH